MRFHQVLVGASPGDAVTHIALAVDDVVGKAMPTTISAHHVDPGCDPRIRQVHLMERPEPHDLVLYHHSIGEPDVVEWIVRQPARLLVMYHNVTPASYFDGLDSAFARLLRAGRAELGLIAGRSELVLADSTYNADEVRRASPGSNVRVVPPPLDSSARWLRRRCCCQSASSCRTSGRRC
jgi:hypothetical protein